jgi:hypothetical protein
MRVKEQSIFLGRKGILTLVLVLLIFGAVYFIINASNVEVEENSLKITGMYGATLKYEDITSVELKESLPVNLRRTNGIDFLGNLLGKFKSDDMDNLKLIVKSKHDKLIYINTKNNEHFIINEKDEKDTEALFNDIDSKVKK